MVFGDVLLYFNCADIGMTCSFETSAPTKEDLLKKITVHLAEEHDINEVSPDLAKKIDKAIKTENLNW